MFEVAITGAAGVRFRARCKMTTVAGRIEHIFEGMVPQTTQVSGVTGLCEFSTLETISVEVRSSDSVARTRVSRGTVTLSLS